MSFIFHGSSWATVAGLQSLKAAYPGLDVKMYNCKVCHIGAVGKKGNLNLYGLSLQKSKLPGDAKKLTVEDLRTIETKDADNDGVSNAEEIKLGAPPGDPALVPAGAAKISIPTEVPVEVIPPTATEPAAPTEKNDKIAPATVPQNSSHKQGSRSIDQLLALLREGMIPEAFAEEKIEPTKAEYVGIETCASCHNDIAKSHQHSSHARIVGEGPEGMDISCESCHGPGSLHVEAGGGRNIGNLIIPSKDPSTCFSCHTDKKMEFALQYHHPVPEGRMSCADCHSAHGEKPTPRSARDQNELCLKCHQQIKGPWVFEHLAMRDGCLTCHAPHGSITTRLLTERNFNSCLKCHYSASQFQRIGHYAHRRATNVSTMEGANCTGCHRSIHGSNFSKELRTQ